MAKPLSFYGQINYTQLKKALRSGNVKAQRIQTKNGEEIVFDINVWVHEEADQYNNNAAIQCTLTKEAYEANVKNDYYIGNCRYKEPKSTEATQEDINNAVGNDDDDLPF
ncbi:hypothetical protein RG089_002546 [Elizabethkingia anophelis]|nr:hypothetical protein [Elizabethkingia anophelis]